MKANKRKISEELTADHYSLMYQEMYQLLIISYCSDIRRIAPIYRIIAVKSR